MAKLTYNELYKEFEFESKINKKKDEEYGQIHMSNDLFERFAKEEALTKKNKKRVSTHVDVAYSYLYLVSWYYRNAIYGLSTELKEVEGIKQVLGYSPKSKEIDYIIKKNGVLDKMGLTKTLPFKEAPILAGFDDDVLQFIFADSLETKTWTNRKTFKYPVFALEDEDGIWGEGTCFGNVENTVYVDFRIFMQCMSNKELGCNAFYIYSFLKWKSEVSGENSIEIGYSTIMEKTGLTDKKVKNAIYGLRKYNLVHCIPAPFVVGATEGEGANRYYVNDYSEYNAEGKEYTKRKLVNAEKEKK